MKTFLVTSKMDPALAARVEASVSGQRGRRHVAASSRPRTVVRVRFFVLALLLGVVTSVAFVVRRDRLELERTRAALLGDVRGKSAPLTTYDLAYLTRVESWITVLAGAAYEGDFVADDLKAPGALAAALGRSAVYVRGPMAELASAAGVAKAAAYSAKDPLAMCLVDPPAARTEKALVAKVRGAYSAGGALELATPNMRRLYEVNAGLPFLLAPFAARVVAAKEPEDLAELRTALEKAPVSAAARGVKSALLLVAIDEPGDGHGPTELDGERAHAVRVGLVDMVASKLLVRLRRSVDPAWITAGKHAEYASGLDGCKLAMDVRDAVSGLNGTECAK